jgi:heme-degrading monooxygenase HmoA
MVGSGGQFTSGDWHVKRGNEDQFISRWTDFVRWSKESSEGAREFFLIQQLDDPGHFLSFGRWESQDAVGAWRQNQEFPARLGRCRELCDEFDAHDFNLVSHVQ